jgi:hypothetical protein
LATNIATAAAAAAELAAAAAAAAAAELAAAAAELAASAAAAAELAASAVRMSRIMSPHGVASSAYVRAALPIRQVSSSSIASSPIQDAAVRALKLTKKGQLLSRGHVRRRHVRHVQRHVRQRHVLMLGRVLMLRRQVSRRRLGLGVGWRVDGRCFELS